MKSDTAADTRIRAISSFLLDRDPLVLALASRLGSSNAVFESAIHGSSMSPSIPGRVRLRVQLLGERRCHTGDIVYFLADNGFTVHRLAYQTRRSSAESYVITFGDNCLAPDPPLRKDRILGTVIAFETAAGWQTPGPQKAVSICHRLCRAIAYAAMVATFSLSIGASRRLAGFLARLESAGRAPVGNLLRRLHLISVRR